MQEKDDGETPMQRFEKFARAIFAVKKEDFLRDEAERLSKSLRAKKAALKAKPRKVTTKKKRATPSR